MAGGERQEEQGLLPVALKVSVNYFSVFKMLHFPYSHGSEEKELILTRYHCKN